MRAVCKFLSLPVRDRLLLVRAAMLLVSLRVALRLIPFKRLSRIRFRRNTRAPEETDRLLWSVCCASRWMPAPTCLVQALALHILLARAGHDSRVRIGVTNRSRTLDAHAWVELNGRILLGGPEVRPYQPLFSIQAEPS